MLFNYSVLTRPRPRANTETEGIGFYSNYWPQTKFAKVMFSQVYVCPQGEACMAGGHAWQRGVAERWPLQRLVRILLECILVSGNVFTAPTPRPMQISISSVQILSVWVSVWHCRIVQINHKRRYKGCGKRLVTNSYLSPSPLKSITGSDRSYNRVVYKKKPLGSIHTEQKVKRSEEKKRQMTKKNFTFHFAWWE